MLYTIVRTVFAFCLNLVVWRATARALRIRRKQLYYGIELVLFVFDCVLRAVTLSPVLRLALFWFLQYLIVPIVLGTGPLVSRIIRALLLQLVEMMVELAGTFVYTLVTGEASPPAVFDATNIGPIVVTYSTLIVLAIVLFELVLGWLERGDEGYAAGLELPFAFFLIVAVVFFHYVYDYHFALGYAPVLQLMIMVVAYVVFTILVSAGLLWAARRDMAARRLLVRHRASKQQLATLKKQLAQGMSRTDALRKLRHDIANQVDVVHELGATGRIQEASAHLERLSTEATSLMEG
jgi:ribosomal protein L29